jgi:hypothetical protein
MNCELEIQRSSDVGDHPNCVDLFLLRVHIYQIIDLLSYSLPSIHVHNQQYLVPWTTRQALITVAAPCLTSLQLRRTEAASIAIMLVLFTPQPIRVLLIFILCHDGISNFFLATALRWRPCDY